MSESKRVPTAYSGAFRSFPRGPANVPILESLHQGVFECVRNEADIAAVYELLQAAELHPDRFEECRLFRTHSKYVQSVRECFERALVRNGLRKNSHPVSRTLPKQNVRDTSALVAAA